MAMILTQRSKLSLKILCIFFFMTQSLAPEVETNHLVIKPSAYEVLGDYNFPIGVLPKGVLGYDLDSSSGKFSAFLNGSCSFSLKGSYQLRYKSTVKGYISRGKLSSLQGVSVKLFFMWVDIVEVLRRGDNLKFSVGIAGADFPLDNFEECPQCGCGLNCNNEQVERRTSGVQLLAMGSRIGGAGTWQWLHACSSQGLWWAVTVSPFEATVMKKGMILLVDGAGKRKMVAGAEGPASFLPDDRSDLDLHSG